MRPQRRTRSTGRGRALGTARQQPQSTGTRIERRGGRVVPLSGRGRERHGNGGRRSRLHSEDDEQPNIPNVEDNVERLWSSQERIWRVSVKEELTDHTASFLESILQLVRLIFCENTGVTYLLTSSLLRGTVQAKRRALEKKDENECYECKSDLEKELPHDYGGDVLPKYDPSDGALDMQLMSETLSLHELAGDKLSAVASSTHLGEGSCVPFGTWPTPVFWSCQRCVAQLSEIMMELRNVNPSMCQFGRELLRIGKRTLPFARDVAGKILFVLLLHIQHARQYLQDIKDLSSSDLRQFRNKFGKCDITPMKDDEDHITGWSFPGRRQYMPLLTFDEKVTHFCSKEYPNTGAHTPGLLTVQCSCSSPKLIGFYVMDRPESSSPALSSAISHLRVIPRMLFYDNACNLCLSAYYRAAWFMELCIIQIDRFHCEHHSCVNYFNPSMYPCMEQMKTMGAESINARIKRAKHHMRYLRGDNFVSYFRVRFALLNLKACF